MSTPAGYLVVESGPLGTLPERFAGSYTTVDAAKRAAMLRNRKRPCMDIWWVVADAAGVPLKPQP